MGHFVRKNTQILYDAFDLSGDSNAVGMNFTTAEVDNTTFGNTARKRLPGLKSAGITGVGFLDYADDDQDEKVQGSELGVVDRVVTIAEVSGAEGQIAYSFENLLSSYKSNLTHGDAGRFEVAGNTSGRFFRGTILNASSASRNSSTSGTAYNLGAVSATQKLYAALHVLSVAGTSTPTLTVKVQSDSAEGFSSASDVVTFTAATAVGAQFATPVSGALSDTWWRANWALTGTNPVFTFALVVGIQ